MAQHDTTKTISKVVYAGDVLIDLTTDTADETDVLIGQTFHLSNGEIGHGSNPFDADTSDATASAAEILKDKVGYVKGSPVIGTMPNIGRQDITITAKAQAIPISRGYHDGSGRASIHSTEQAKIIPGNIKNGVVILGVSGTYTGAELIKATTGSGTPGTSAQIILPSSFGTYDYFTQFTVNAIPYSEVQNVSTGYTATIAAASS